MKRHLIVEGMDGTGKSTLVDLIRKEMGYELAPRFCTSLGGPINDLWTQLKAAIRTLPELTPKIFDRIPLVSEPIYGSILRDYPSVMFGDTPYEKYCRSEVEKRVKQECTVVWCHPPLLIVLLNLRTDPETQLGGVVSHAKEIYSEYVRVMPQWSPIIWDYTVNSLPSLLEAIRND